MRHGNEFIVSAHGLTYGLSLPPPPSLHPPPPRPIAINAIYDNLETRQPRLIHQIIILH